MRGPRKAVKPVLTPKVGCDPDSDSDECPWRGYTRATPSPHDQACRNGPGSAIAVSRSGSIASSIWQTSHRNASG